MVIPAPVTRASRAGVVLGGGTWFRCGLFSSRMVMAAAVPLRPDFDAAALRPLAKQSRAPDQIRRLLALATIYEGQPRSEAARVGCVTLQSVRDWVLRFNAQGPAGLINGKAPGRRAILNETQRAALQAMVEQGPILAIHGVVRWRWVDLIAWLWEEVCLSISQQTLSRELRAMNYRKLSARPRHEEVCLSISQQTLSRELRAMNYRKLSARPRHEEVCLSISQQTLSRELRAMNYRKLSARPRHYAQNEHAADVFKKRSPTAWRRSQRRSAARRSRFGSRTRRGLDKRTRSRGAGPSAARAPQRLRISEQPRLISSARSVQLPAKELAWSCRAARHRAWNCT